MVYIFKKKTSFHLKEKEQLRLIWRQQQKSIYLLRNKMVVA